MRRKNWINKKKYFYDNYNLNSKFFNLFLIKNNPLYDEYNTKGQLYKVLIKKNKLSLLIPEINYYYYSDFFKSLKKISKKIIYKNYLFNSKNALVLLPSYLFKSQFFSNKSLFDGLLFNYKLRGFFIYNSFFKTSNYSLNPIFYKRHLIGYNFYIVKSNFNKYNDFLKITDDKDFNGVGKVKFFLENFNNSNASLNKEVDLFFLYNIYILKILEIYKILFFVFIFKINLK